MHDHLVLLREFLGHASERAGAAVTVLAGFSSGADVVMRLLAAGGTEQLRVQGVLALGCNLSLEPERIQRHLDTVLAGARHSPRRGAHGVACVVRVPRGHAASPPRPLHPTR
jgi:hypothetical protein